MAGRIRGVFVFPWCCAAACVSLPPSSDFGETSRRDQAALASVPVRGRGGVSAERRILPLHFSDGGFLPKAATRPGLSLFIHPNGRPEPASREKSRFGPFSAFFKGFPARLDDLTAWLDALSLRLDEKTARFDGLSSRLTETSSRLDHLTARLDGRSSRLDEKTLRLDDLSSRINELTVRLIAKTSWLAETSSRLK